jgi:pimeloyl-ACP methyl ester carboxylesterase
VRSPEPSPATGVALGTVRYRCRGWNGDRADTGTDARAAPDALERTVGPVPVVLVGHSLGGRAALRVADHPLVRGVVALAPWCPPDEPVAGLAGQRAVLLHCPRDRVTDPHGSGEFVRRARTAGAGAWRRLTAALTAGLLDTTGLLPVVAAALAPGADRLPLDAAELDA